MPQLDGLRTLAVGGVMAQHFQVFSGAAGYGVHLFFVLSGFLITGILVAERRNVAELGITRRTAFTHFYIRRALRIFPLYYFIVIAGIVLNVEYAREYAPWLLTYTINLKMAAQGWYIDNFSHFWSLAIEEQYYLVWPWLILLLPRKWLNPSAVIMIAIAPLFRVWVALQSHAVGNTGWIAGYIATPTALDSLGMGSLLAILSRDDVIAPRLESWMRYAIPITSFAALVAIQLGPRNAFHLVLVDTIAAVFFAWLIYRASRGFGGIVGAFLSAAPIVFLGRISYGLYVYHPLIPGLTLRIARLLGVPTPAPDKLASWAPAFLAVTVCVATISWYVLENPINKLKSRFPYRSSHSGTTVSVPAGS
jgi:peptidoglycan/LPS O-acetylase OafA/YrhL